MIPKLALVGVFETLRSFCEAGKTSVMSTVGPLNTTNLLLFFGALKKSLELGEDILINYKNTQNALRTMEQATELAKQEITNEEEENNQINHIEDDQENSDNNEENGDDDHDDDQSEFLRDFDIRKLN